MSRSIVDIEQELETLRDDEKNLRKERNNLLNLLPNDPTVQKSLDIVNQLMNSVLISQNNKIEEIKVLRDRGMFLI